MAGVLLGMGGQANVNVMEFCVDSVEDIQYLPTTKSKGADIYPAYAPLGSTCIVGNEAGDLKLYMLFSFGWKET